MIWTHLFENPRLILKPCFFCFFFISKKKKQHQEKWTIQTFLLFKKKLFDHYYFYHHEAGSEWRTRNGRPFPENWLIFYPFLITFLCLQNDWIFVIVELISLKIVFECRQTGRIIFQLTQLQEYCHCNITPTRNFWLSLIFEFHHCTETRAKNTDQTEICFCFVLVQ